MELIKKMLQMAKSDGRKILVFDVTGDCQVFTNEPVSEFASMFGKALAGAANALYRASNKKFDRSQILEAILVTAVPTAQRILNEREDEDTNPSIRRSASG